MSKILVTGCAGFIASHLTEELLRQGHEIVGIDNLNSYYLPELKKRNLKIARSNKNFTFILGSILDKSALKKIGNPDIIFHDAAMAGVRTSLDKPLIYLENNTLGTINLLEHFKDIEKFIYASSSSIYGNVPKSQLPVKETQDKKPISPYGLSKLQGEKWCELYSRIYSLKTVSLRFFTVYGPRQRPDEAMCKFIGNVLAGKPLKIYGDGEQTRDFTFVKDVVNAHILAIERGRGVYNIGSGRNITVNEIVKLISRITGKKPIISYTDEQAGDVPHTLADIKKAREDLEYEPKYSIESGLREHINWFKEQKP